MSDDGYQGNQSELFRQLDARLCECGHKSISHAWKFAFGDGRCGLCDCSSLSIHSVKGTDHE